MSDETKQEQPSTTSAPSPNKDSASAIREEFERQRQTDMIQSLFKQYSEGMTEREQKALGGLLRGIQKEAEDGGNPIGSSGGLSVQQAFDVAYETLKGHKFGEQPEETEEAVEETEETPHPPGKQAAPTPKGVATEVTDDEQIQIGDVPTEDLQMYVDVRNTLRQMTKTAKSENEGRNAVLDIVKNITKEKARQQETT